MKARSRLLLAGFSMGGIAAGFAAPAHATLQLTVGLAGSEASFTCVDNSTCDSNPVEGVIDIPTISFEGLVGSNIVVESIGTVHGISDATLRYRVGSLFNGSGQLLHGRFAVSDTDFRGPPGTYQTKADVAWTNGGDSSLDLISTFDPDNAQGGNTPTDAPGSEIDAVSFAASDGDQEPGSVSGASLFSLSDQGDLLLEAGATVSGGQDVTVAIVPEPSTWAMMAIGFAELGFAGLRRARRRPALVG